MMEWQQFLLRRLVWRQSCESNAPGLATHLAHTLFMLLLHSRLAALPAEHSVRLATLTATLSMMRHHQRSAIRHCNAGEVHAASSLLTGRHHFAVLDNNVW